MDKINAEQLNAIVGLASTVLHMLYACVAVLIGSMGLYYKIFYGVKEAKAAAVRAHRRVDDTNERVGILEERVYDLK